MCKIIIFGGTTEGRLLAEFCNRAGLKTHVCAATEYGGSLVAENSFVTVSDKRLNVEEMAGLLDEKQPDMVIDATHPFAVDVTENIKKACETCGVEYLRLLRAGLDVCYGGEGIGRVFVDSVEEAVEFLRKTEGRVLVTTGSKELKKFTALAGYKERVVARVLSTAEVAEQCREMGFEGSNLICMQGPFSRELNVAILKQYNCKYLVTKASGTTGGFEDKIQAAGDCGVTAVIIGRPSEEDGVSLFQCRKLLCERYGLKTEQTVALVGIGMGANDSLTGEAVKCLSEAELVIGAKRIADAAGRGQDIYYEYDSRKIAEYINSHPEYEKVAVALSGDIGFYSGAKKLAALMGNKKSIKYVPGISSVSYFMGKTGLSWDNAVIVSNHGIETSLVPLIRDNEKVFSILGKPDDVKILASKLIEYGLDYVKIHVGERLSYPDEKIFCGTPDELVDYENDKLAVLVAENPAFMKSRVNPFTCRRDEEFLRGKVPMTKEEIRTISINKLRLTADAVCYDVGAGTGSVSIDMAVKATGGKVFAIEKKAEAAELLKKNKLKFRTDNLEIIEGLAPGAMAELPAPTHVFIGGSSGNMEHILEAVFAKNPEARVVINSIALESTAEAVACAKKFSCGDDEIIQVAVSKAKTVGPYSMMTGENPITIVAFTGKDIR